MNSPGTLAVLPNAPEGLLLTNSRSLDEGVAVRRYREIVDAAPIAQVGHAPAQGDRLRPAGALAGSRIP